MEQIKLGLRIASIVVGAVRDWIGVMNSEKKYRDKKMPGRD